MNAKIVSLILNSVESHISIALKRFSTAKEMFEYLKRVYQQSNLARRYQVEHDDTNIHEYYPGFFNLLSDYEMLCLENTVGPCHAGTIQGLFEK